MTSSRYRYCTVPMCKSTTIRTPEKTFISAPHSEELRKQWMLAMRRKDPLSLKSSFVVCSDHFNLENDMENYVRWSLMPKTPIRMKPGVVPHIFECQGKKRRSPDELEIKRARTQFVEEILKEHEKEQDKEEPDDAELLTVNEVEPEMVLINVCAFEQTKHQDVACQASFRAKFRSKATQCIVKTKEVMVSATPNVKDVATMTDAEILNETDSDTSDDMESISEDMETNDPVFEDKSCYEITKQKVLTNPMLFIGVPKNAIFIIQKLAKYCKTTERNILFCLKKIKWNEPYEMLAYDFDLSPSYLARVFESIVPNLAECLRRLIKWPSKEKVLKNLPKPFKGKFSKVVAIMECFEIEIEKPSNHLHQALSWSDSKKCNTLKYLVAFTPDGTCCFISNGFGGRTSDSVILKQSRFLEKIEKKVYLMADGGFKHIEEELIKKGARLVRCPSTDTESFFKKDTVLQKKIANLKIIVEKVIGRLRHFRFLAPHVCLDDDLTAHTDAVTTIVCGLMNLQSPLIRLKKF